MKKNLVFIIYFIMSCVLLIIFFILLFELILSKKYNSIDNWIKTIGMLIVSAWFIKSTLQIKK